MKALTHLFCLVAMCCLAILQQSLLPNLWLGQWGLNLVFIAVFFLSAKEGKYNFGFWAGLWGGIFLDTISVAPWGFFTISLTLTSLVTGRISRLIQKNSWLSLLPLFLASFLVYEIVSFLTLTVLGTVHLRPKLVLATLIVNLAVVSLVFGLIKLFSKKGRGYAYF